MKKRAPSELGIFAASGYPTATADAPKQKSLESPPYVSPLIAIHQAIRRRNPVAAAAAANFGSSSTATSRWQDSSDPWDSLATKIYDASNDQDGEELDRRRSNSVGETDMGDLERQQLEGTCKCRTMRRSSSSSLQSSTPSSSAKPSSARGTCSQCGKRKARQNSFARRRTQSLGAGYHGYNYNSNKNTMQEPQHAQALLQSTPQLRIISPASTDMQAYGNDSNRNVLQRILPFVVEHGQNILGNNNSKRTTIGISAIASTSSGSKTVAGFSEYKTSLLRDRANQEAAAELASLLWVLAHEMKLEDYGTVESQVFTAVFSLVHAPDKDRRMAGLAALDALLAAPSADKEKKAIKFANALSNGLRAAHGDYEYLSAVSKALGHMATTTANVDLVESEVTRALEWLRMERSDRR
jgi:hypothetical protein